MNCVDVCPKGLNPTLAIGKIKDMMMPCDAASVERRLDRELAASSG